MSDIHFSTLSQLKNTITAISHRFKKIDKRIDSLPNWAKQSTKPTYTAEEVGALPSDTVIPSKTSQLQNDSGFLTEHQNLDGYATQDYVNDVAGHHADWDENNPTSKSYIENRPFYSEFGDEINVLDSTEFTFSSQGMPGVVYTNPSNLYLNNIETINEGDYVAVTIDGEKHELIVQNSLYVGGANPGDSQVLENGFGLSFQNIPMMPPKVRIGFVLFAGEVGETHTISLNYKPLEIVQLPKKYIPGSLITHGTGKQSEIFNNADTNTASGDYSHCEGINNTASGYASHCEGMYNNASGQHSHCEGIDGKSSGYASHVENEYCIATGQSSHAEGRYTLASSRFQHVQGTYNIDDASNRFAHIVGNGSSENYRSNAHTLDWDGNGWYAGKLTVGSNPTNSMDVATKQYVDEAVGNIESLLASI